MYLCSILLIYLIYYTYRYFKHELTFILGQVVLIVILVCIQSYLLYINFNIITVGSDASWYYGNAKAIYENWSLYGINKEIFNFLNISNKYVFYTLFDLSGFMPYFSDRVSCIMSEISYGIVVLIYILRVKRYIVKAKIREKKSALYALLVSFYWCLTLNFRDAMISMSISLIILAYVLEKNLRKKIIKIFFAGLWLSSLRPNMIYVLILTLIIFKIWCLLKKLKWKNGITIIITFIATSIYINFSGSGAVINAIKPSIIGLLVSNPIKYYIYYFQNGISSSAWHYTFLTVVLNSLVALGLVFIVYTHMISGFFYERNDESKKIWIIGIIILITTYLMYSIKLGGVQERIKLMSSTILLLSYIFAKPTKRYIKVYRLVSILLIFYTGCYILKIII